ncbi:MAG: lysophospholipid acyltransferase family protein [Sulfurospirillum sp.]
MQKIAPKIIYLIANILYLTCKKKFHTKIAPKDLNKPTVIAFWHGELLSVLKGYLFFVGNPNIDSIVSEHSDGEIIAKTVSLFGGGTIRGSSTRGGIKVLKQSFKALQKGRNIAITPDGPKGPRHSVADGIVLISQKKMVPIVTFNCKPTSYWQFKSWDRFIIPKPFSTLDFYIGEPFLLDGLSLQESKKLIKERLKENAV